MINELKCTYWNLRDGKSGLHRMAAAVRLYVAIKLNR